MVLHQVEAFHIDKGHPIIRSARRSENAHHGEPLAVACSFRISVRRGKRLAELDVQFRGNLGPHDRLEVAVLGVIVLEVAACREFVLLVALRSERQPIKEVGGRSDDAKRTVVVSQTQRNGQAGERAVFPVAVHLEQRRGGFLYGTGQDQRTHTGEAIGKCQAGNRPVGSLGGERLIPQGIPQLFGPPGLRQELQVEVVGHVFDRLAEIVHRVQCQLEFAPLGSDDHVVAQARVAAKRLRNHAGNRQHGHHHHDAEGHGESGQDRGQPPLLETSPRDSPETHSRLRCCLPCGPRPKTRGRVQTLPLSSAASGRRDRGAPRADSPMARLRSSRRSTRANCSATSRA